MPAEPIQNRASLRRPASVAVLACVGLAALAVLATSLVAGAAARRREEDRAGALATALLASRLAPLAAAGDRPGVEQAVAASVRDSPQLAYLRVRHARTGDVWGQAFSGELREEDRDLRHLPAPGEAVELGERRALARAAPLGDAPFTLEFGLFAHGGALGEAALPALAALLLLLAGFAALHLFARRQLDRRARPLVQEAEQIALGDLGRSLGIEGADALAQLGQSFDRTAANLRSVVVDLRAAAQSAEKDARALIETSSQQSALASKHSEELIEAALSIGEIASSAQLSRDQADSVIAGTSRSEAMTQSGTAAVEDTRSAMEKLATQVETIVRSIDALVSSTAQIGGIVTKVQDLAERSNLLALNASIEAARAGASGQGFAVVAQQMRLLANQSKSEAAEIRSLLTGLNAATRAAVAAAEEGSARAAAGIAVAQTARSAIDGLAGVISSSSDAVRQIAAQSRSQGAGIEQVAQVLNELSSAMAQSLELAQRIEGVAGHLSTQSSGLTQLTERYRV